MGQSENKCRARPDCAEAAARVEPDPRSRGARALLGCCASGASASPPCSPLAVHWWRCRCPRPYRAHRRHLTACTLNQVCCSSTRLQSCSKWLPQWQVVSWLKTGPPPWTNCPTHYRRHKSKLLPPAVASFSSKAVHSSVCVHCSGGEDEGYY